MVVKSLDLPLLFEYDNYLFFKVNIEKNTKIKWCLLLYEHMFRQNVYFEKCSFMFSHKTEVTIKEELLSFFGVPHTNQVKGIKESWWL